MSSKLETWRTLETRTESPLPDAIAMKPTLLPIALTSSLFAVERPEVTVPRQTSGDTAVQPTWKETLTGTVGTKDAGIVGSLG